MTRAMLLEKRVNLMIFYFVEEDTHDVRRGEWGGQREVQKSKE